MKKLLIDAFSTSSGGAISHLRIILNNFSNQNYFDKVDVLLPTYTKKQMPKIKNVNYICNRFFEKNLFLRIFFQIVYLNIKCFFENYSCIFITGSSHLILKKPVVTINQNLLPFSDNEIKKYFFSYFFIKLKLLYLTQTLSLIRSQGIIFLHKFSKKIIINKIGYLNNLKTIIPHNIDFRFKKSSYKNKKVRLIYVSNIDHYKNQVFLLKAIDELLEKKPKLKELVSVEFYGSYYLPALKNFENYRLNKLINKLSFKFMGLKKKSYIYREINNKDTIFLFASTCENFSVSLIEGMAKGYPILCVNIQPMKSVLGKCALFYKNNSIKSFQNQLLKIIFSKKMKKRMSFESFQKSKAYINNDMAKKTYKFLEKVSKVYT